MVIPNREGKCCDAVIRQLERATGAERTAVSDPESTGEGPPVDLRVTLGSQEYALEHTRVLPFDDRIAAAKAYQDIRACLAEWFAGPLPGGRLLRVLSAAGCSAPRTRQARDQPPERAAANGSGARRPVAAGPRTRAGADGRRRCTSSTTRAVGPDGWDCEFALGRSSDGVVPPREAGTLGLFVGSRDEPEPVGERRGGTGPGRSPPRAMVPCRGGADAARRAALGRRCAGSPPGGRKRQRSSPAWAETALAGSVRRRGGDGASLAAGVGGGE